MTESTTLLKPSRPVGIIGYGAYVPRYRLPAKEVARIWTGGKTSGLPIKEKAVPGLDEDVVTMSLEAVRNALKRAGIDPAEIRAVWIGSESHPYAVKPTSTIVAEAIGATPNVQAADMEFACKAGTEAMVMAMGMVGSGMARYAMAIGLDTAQGKPGDALEYTAAAGGAAFVIGPAEESLAVINSSYSFVTDTPDFWRREYQKYPEHGVALHRRAGLLQAYSRSRKGHDGSQRDDRQRLPVGRLPPAQCQVPEAGGRGAGIQPRADRTRAALAGDRQYLCRSGHHRSDCHTGCGQTRRPHPDGFVRLRSRVGCFRSLGHG